MLFGKPLMAYLHATVMFTWLEQPVFIDTNRLRRKVFSFGLRRR